MPRSGRASSATARSGIGGAPHLTMELLKQKFGFDIAHVPYRNSPQSIADVAAGHVVAVVRRGRRLAAADQGRQAARARRHFGDALPTLPDVPPFAEAAGVRRPRSGFVARAARSPRHAARPIVDKLHGEMKRIMARPEMQQKIVNIGLIPHDIALDRRPAALREGGKREMGHPGAPTGVGRLAIADRRAQTARASAG